MRKTSFEFTSQQGFSHKKQPSCSVKNCCHIGEYKAKRSPREMGLTVYFCLKHIREHYARWNYYAHMTCEEIQRENEADVTWRRPSFPFGAHRTPMTEQLKQAFRRFMDEEEDNPANNHYPKAVKKALHALHLKAPFSIVQLKKKYYQLAKMYHPDVNTSKEAAEKFKQITDAYETLRLFLKTAATGNFYER